MGGGPKALGEDGPKPRDAGKSAPTSRWNPTVQSLPRIPTSNCSPSTPGTGNVRPFNRSMVNCRVSGCERTPARAPPPITAVAVMVAIRSPILRRPQSLSARSRTPVWRLVNSVSTAGTATTARMMSLPLASRGVSGPGPAGTSGVDSDGGVSAGSSTAPVVVGEGGISNPGSI